VTFRKTSLIRAACSLALLGSTLAADAQEHRVELTNGDILTGTVLAQTEESLTLEHPILGEITLEASRIAHVTEQANQAEQDDAERPVPGDAAAAETPAKPDPMIKAVEQAALEAAIEDRTFWQRFMEDWNSKLTLGLNGSSGNTERQNYRIMFNTRQTDGRDRWDFNSRWVYAYANGRKNQSQFETNLTREWLQEDSPWFFFIKGQYKYDVKRSYQNRTSGFGGGGYTLAETEDLEVNTRMGFGGTYEYGSVNEFTPEALFGGSVISWKVNERSSLAGETLFYPSLQNGDDYRIESTFEWVYKLDLASGMSFKIGLENEYNSNTRGDNSNNDLKYYGAIVLSF
jgi:hypothetical protein